MQTHIKSLNTKLPFTQAVRCGDFVYVSGQASVDPVTGEIRAGTLAEEMTLSFQNHVMLFQWEAALMGVATITILTRL